MGCRPTTLRCSSLASSVAPDGEEDATSAGGRERRDVPPRQDMVF